MKLILFLLVLLENGVNSTAGLRVFYFSQEIILQYFFNSNYNNYEKSCCKFYQSECIIFVNSRGYEANLYRGRIFFTNYYGRFEVRMTKLSMMDAGRYRCGFSSFPATYQYVQVTVSELTRIGVNTVPLLPKFSIKPSVWPSTSPSPSMPTVSEDDKDKQSDSWRASYTLAAVLSVLLFAVISATLLVYRLNTRKKKSTGKSEICGSPNISEEQNAIIYSMVEFKPHQDPSELYANLQMHNPKDTDFSSNCNVTVEESVEYSTIMRAPP
ncbi:uncharacterized protein LOC127962994 isoform X2 [Carassius gibelio]|uniref:uncharacterized protein LOC127962994 isoform X2 n=1 Tax=Carassius gibelio TaxID=101364 RepID=UPI002278FB57|nr:uncharacterized protein LOC127962994 isoform X2 [Carassius gibelio]